MAKYKIVVNIGCIECGVGTDIVGIFPAEEADAMLSTLQNKYHWRDGGDNTFEAFDYPEIGTMSSSYNLEKTAHHHRD